MRKTLFAALPLVSASLFAQGTPEALEPTNNTVAGAAVLALGAQAYGDIDVSGTDEDWFQITLTGASDLRVWTGPGFVAQIGDTRVQLLGATGAPLVPAIDIDDGNTTTHGYYTTFTVGNLAAGTYHVAVRGYDAFTFGSYTLDVVAVPAGTYLPLSGPLVPVVEGPEVNDPRIGGGVATASGLGTQNAGNCPTAVNGTSYTAAADYDFYQIVVPSTGLLSMSTVAGAVAPALTDTVIHLADASLARLAFDDDSGPGFLSVLNYTITTPGIYYVVVSCWTPVGNYLLNISFSPPLPVGVATTTAQVGGCAGSVGVPTLNNRLSSTHAGVRPERCVLGSTYELDCTNLPASAPLFTFIGLAAGPNFDLTPFGAPGCLLEIPGGTTGFVLGDPAGHLWWSIATPFSTLFIGLPLEQQVVVLDAGANPAGVSVSNRVSTVAGVSH